MRLKKPLQSQIILSACICNSMFFHLSIRKDNFQVPIALLSLIICSSIFIKISLSCGSSNTS